MTGAPASATTYTGAAIVSPASTGTERPAGLPKLARAR
jgi:hypothetical protein